MTHGGGWVPAVTHVNPKYNHATVPRLLEGTTYEFRVCAENLQGRSDPLTTDHSIVAKNQFGKFSTLSSDMYTTAHKYYYTCWLYLLENPNKLFILFSRTWTTWKARMCRRGQRPHQDQMVGTDQQRWIEDHRLRRGTARSCNWPLVEIDQRASEIC